MKYFASFIPIIATLAALFTVAVLYCQPKSSLEESNLKKQLDILSWRLDVMDKRLDIIMESVDKLEAKESR